MITHDKRKQPHYTDYFKVKQFCSFNKINDNNVIDYLSKIKEYINQYKEKSYSYILIKDFILGLSLSVNKKEINIVTLKNINNDILKLSEFISNSSFYQKDIVAKKEYLDKAFRNITSQINGIEFVHSSAPESEEKNKPQEGFTPSYQETTESSKTNVNKKRKSPVLTPEITQFLITASQEEYQGFLDELQQTRNRALAHLKSIQT